MLVQKELLAQLKSLGINSYETKLWTALLSKGSASAGELSDLSNVPRSRAYDVLQSLERKGFIMMKLGRPIRYVAVPPESVLETVKKRVIEDAEARNKAINKLIGTETISELMHIYKSGVGSTDASNLSGSIKGRRNVYSYVDGLIKKAGKSVTIMTTADGFLRKNSEFMKSFRKAKARNVRIRIAAPLDAFGPDGEKAVSEMKGICEVFPTREKARFFVVDSKHIVFFVSDEAGSSAVESAVWLTAPFLASAFERLFESSV